MNNDVVLKEVLKSVENKKGKDLKLLDIKDLSSVADYFFICVGNTTTQTKAIADGIEKDLKEKLQVLPLRIEGYQQGHWILMDYNFLVIHIFTPEEKDFYDLERIWGDAKIIDVQYAGD